jgi:dTDP-4-dehydrorhamnose 3,5-epimerase
MKIKKSFLEGAAEIECSSHKDERGWFARYYCQEELKEVNSNLNIVQINSSFTEFSGTIRGLHLQKKPYEEDKIVRCIAGKIYDVILDNREDSDTYGKWQGVILDSKKMNMFYVPKGFAHGFQTLTPNCQVLYLHTEFHHPASEDGFHYKSPELNINWPLEVNYISERDMKLDFFKSN